MSNNGEPDGYEVLLQVVILAGLAAMFLFLCSLAAQVR